ncbi:MAG: CoA-binding protein [Candidatus Obscuribacterales bacterium]
MESIDSKIDAFLAAPSVAVVGASDDKNKYGHRVLVCYKQNQRKAFPVNPNAAVVLGETCYPDLLSLPEKVESVSIITPPAVTRKVVDDAIAAGVKNLWMQPGAESRDAIAKAEEAGLRVIHGGACVLVVLGYHGE